MPDTPTTQTPQIDWATILKPIIDAALPELMKALPKLLPQIIAAFLPGLLKSIGLPTPAPTPATPPATSLPQGTVTGILGALGAVLAGVLQAKGWLPAGIGDPATIAGLTAAAVGGSQAAAATLLKSKS